MTANTTKTDDQGIISRSPAANGGPTTCPADPAAVVMPKAKDLFSAAAVLPTTASIGPKPLPAIPKPIKTFKNWQTNKQTNIQIHVAKKQNHKPILKIRWTTIEE